RFLTLGTLLAALRFFLREPMSSSFLHNPLKWRSFVPRFEARLASARRQFEALVGVGDRSLPDLLSLATEVQQANAELLAIHRWSLTHAEIGYTVAKKIGRVFGLSSEEVERELSNPQHSKSREMDEALRDIAAMASGCPQLAKMIAEGASFEELAARSSARYPEFASVLAAFLERYGHRASSLDIAAPSFADDPSQVLTLLRALLGEAPADAHTSHPAVAEPAPARFRRVSLAPLFAVVRRYLWLREDQRFYSLKAFQLMRRIYMRIGAIMVEKGCLVREDDILMLAKEEVAACAVGAVSAEDLTGRAKERRAELDVLGREYAEATLCSYPSFLKGNLPYATYERQEEPLGILRGKPVSAGLATGPVRVICSFEDLRHVRAGDILVAPGTDPAWTPVFSRIAGLVMENGGQLSHGAVVAREYALPAVVAVPHVTRLLRDGDVVTVDGSSGSVAVVSG
ncbi:MAG: hypothetical protein HY677_05095, partial [Chloroflexi bacterium]|nr:hypothetical protein [Chloroflexota bacterium]